MWNQKPVINHEIKPYVSNNFTLHFLMLWTKNLEPGIQIMKSNQTLVDGIETMYLCTQKLDKIYSTEVHDFDWSLSHWTFSGARPCFCDVFLVPLHKTNAKYILSGVQHSQLLYFFRIGLRVYRLCRMLLVLLAFGFLGLHSTIRKSNPFLNISLETGAQLRAGDRTFLSRINSFIELNNR